jgi:predicted O-methyltransferase YrrM
MNHTSWLCKKLRGAAAPAPLGPRSEEIERLAAETNELGPQPLWSGYGEHSAGRQVRIPNVVRTKREMGNFYTYLVRQRRPDLVVEFGTAFGVSGMYFLAGLEANGHGRLMTFEPNESWAIDAIHTKAFVNAQLNIVLAKARPGAIIILDDISFSADMKQCWADVSHDARYAAAASIGSRVGIVELAAT